MPGPFYIDSKRQQVGLGGYAFELSNNGDSLYYGDSAVSSSHKTGTIASGSKVVLDEPVWVVSAGSSRIELSPSPQGNQLLTYDADTDTTNIDSENLTVSGVPVVGTQTATLTTDPLTFTVSHVFDLGKPSVFSIVCTVLSGDADGETWAVTAGDVQDGEIAIDVQNVQGSLDGVTWGPIGVSAFPWVADLAGGPSNVAMGPMLGATSRYLRVTGFRIVQDAALAIYSGANHPSATARFDVSVG